MGITFMVMKHVIGSYNKAAGLVPGNISGNRVINAVANKMQVGCADEFETFMNFYKDTGMFGFYVAADEVAVEHAVGELMFRTDGVDAHEVKRVAWKYLNDAEIAITGLGPLHGLPSYYELRRMNTMHRY